MRTHVRFPVQYGTQHLSCLTLCSIFHFNSSRSVFSIVMAPEISSGIMAFRLHRFTSPRWSQMMVEISCSALNKLMLHPPEITVRRPGITRSKQLFGSRCSLFSILPRFSSLSTVSTYLVIAYNFRKCSAQQEQIDASPAGLPYLLVALVFSLIFGIPIALWFWRNYLAPALTYIAVKLTLYSSKAYDKVSLKVSDAGRKISERVRI